MMICITGLPAAGKSSVGGILKSMGFRVYEIGDTIREMMEKDGIPLTPESDRAFTIGMRKRYGLLVFVKNTLKKIRLSKNSTVVIVGIRSKLDIDYLKKYGKVVTIAVVAPIKQRYARIRKRKRSDAPRSLSEFRGRDEREKSFGLFSAINAADYVIAGTGTLSNLRKSIKEVIKEEGLQPKSPQA